MFVDGHSDVLDVDATAIYIKEFRKEQSTDNGPQ